MCTVLGMHEELTGLLVQCLVPKFCEFLREKNTVFSRVICALFFPILAAEKSGCVKYEDFFVEVLIWVLF